MSDPLHDTEAELLAEAQVGLAAENLPGNSAWRAILGMLQQDADAAMEALKTVNPEDVKAVRALQFDVWKHETLLARLEELVRNGLAAYERLRGDHEA